MLSFCWFPETKKSTFERLTSQFHFDFPPNKFVTRGTRRTLPPRFKIQTFREKNMGNRLLWKVDGHTKGSSFSFLLFFLLFLRTHQSMKERRRWERNEKDAKTLQKKRELEIIQARSHFYSHSNAFNFFSLLLLLLPKCFLWSNNELLSTTPFTKGVSPSLLHECLSHTKKSILHWKVEQLSKKNLLKEEAFTQPPPPPTPSFLQPLNIAYIFLQEKYEKFPHFPLPFPPHQIHLTLEGQWHTFLLFSFFHPLHLARERERKNRFLCPAGRKGWRRHTCVCVSLAEKVGESPGVQGVPMNMIHHIQEKSCVHTFAHLPQDTSVGTPCLTTTYSCSGSAPRGLKVPPPPFLSLYFFLQDGV